MCRLLIAAQCRQADETQKEEKDEAESDPDELPEDKVAAVAEDADSDEVMLPPSAQDSAGEATWDSAWGAKPDAESDAKSK